LDFAFLSLYKGPCLCWTVGVQMLFTLGLPV